MLDLQPAVAVAKLETNITSLVKVLVSGVKKSKCIKNENDIAFFSNINKFFISDSIFQNVYKKCEQGFDINALNNDENLRSHIVSYLEYFRQIYQYSDDIIYVKKYRYVFYFVVNNPIIQENIIKPIRIAPDRLKFLFNFLLNLTF